MLCSIITELDFVLNVLLLIVYGLIVLRHACITLPSVRLFTVVSMLVFVFGALVIAQVDSSAGVLSCLFSIETILAILVLVAVLQVPSLEGQVLLLLAFVSQLYMVHCVDILTFYVTLELQNFVFMVLCGLPKTSSTTNGSFTVEAALKFLVLSAFSSGVLLYWFSLMYVVTGNTNIGFRGVDYSTFSDNTRLLYSLMVLAVVMFKVGAAPVHTWVVQVYNSVDRNLLYYISTAPKVSLFGFWVGTFQGVWTEYSVLLFALFSTGLGALGAYGQSKLRLMLAYSTLNEIGLLLSAVETAGFTSLFQHLVVYTTAQALLWNLHDTRMMPALAVSLAGLPPLVGFFGKAWIFYHLGTTGAYTLLVTSLVFTVLSLIYYVRLVRLFWITSTHHNSTVRHVNVAIVTVRNHSSNTTWYQVTGWTSLAMVLLVVLPIFLMRPFVVV